MLIHPRISSLANISRIEPLTFLSLYMSSDLSTNIALLVSLSSLMDMHA